MQLVHAQLILLAFSASCYGQSAAQEKKPQSDVLIFANGDKLTGKIESADSDAVTFASDVAGPVKIPWAKVRELQSASTFVAIPKGVVLVRYSEPTGTLRGKLAINKQDLQLSSDATAAAQSLPLEKVATVIPESTFNDERKPLKFFANWHGRGAFGVELTRSTQDTLGFNTAFNAVRKDPAHTWEFAKSRDTLDFNYIQSKISSGGPSINISILTGLVERDYMVKPRFYVSGIAYFERNSTQGLDLRTNYGGGPGYFLIWNDNTLFDVYAGVRYSNQQLADSSYNRNIFGGRFGESLSHRFKNGATFAERVTYYPAFNYAKGYFASFTTSMSFPVYKRLGVQISGSDNYLNEPPPGFKKNSLQTSVGLNLSF